MSTTENRIPLDVAAPIAEQIRESLAPFCERVEIAGSVRRGLERAAGVTHVGDIELVAIPKVRHVQPSATVSMFDDESGGEGEVTLVDMLAARLDELELREQIHKGLRANGRTSWGARNRFVAWPVSPLMTVGVDIWWALPTTWGWQMVHRTGPSDWAHQLVTARASGGLRPNDMKFEDGALWRYEGQKRRFVPTPDEESLFAALGMAFVPVADRLMDGPDRGGDALSCRVTGCHTRRRSSEVLCRACWYRVPKALRDEIWRLYRGPESRGSRAHLEAIAAAVRIAEDTLATVARG